MPARRIQMRKLKEVLRLRYLAGLSRRKVAECTGVGKTAVSKHIGQADALGLTWDQIEPMSEEKLESLLYPESSTPIKVGPQEPEWDKVAKELRRKGVTKRLLWEEYCQEHGSKAYSYSRFCELYADWKGGIEPVMRFEHVAGEKCFIDYSGMTLDVVDPDTGEVRQAEVFVATLGASNYTFVDVTWSQKLEDFLQSHLRAVEFFGGVPAIFVLDNLKSGVKKADRYEPVLNRTYDDLMIHLGTVGIPARPRKPRDKAKVENAVLHVERWVLAPLRDRTLIGLEAARTAVWEQLDIVNARPFQKMEGSRESMYEELDQPALGPLPDKPWVPADWKTAKVNIDYHIDIDRYYFSVPYRYIGEELDVKVTRDLVEIFRKGQPVASHLRTRNRYSTKSEHMPSSHREHLDWDPPRVVKTAKRIGPSVAELIDRLLSSKRHPEQGYRPSLGIVRLANRWGEDRLEAACRRALSHSACSYHSVKTILEKGLDQIEESQPQAPLIGDHPNIRGGDTYSEGGRSC